MQERPSIPIVFVALVITCNCSYIFMLELTCEKDVGMGLCMFNFVIMLSLHLVSGFFGTSRTSFYIFEGMYFHALQ